MDRLAEIEKIAREWLDDSDYKTSWSLDVHTIVYEDRECDDPVEVEWDERLHRWEFMSSEDDPITTDELMKLMEWATNIGARVTAYDGNHHSNVLEIEIENGKVITAG